MLVQKNKQEQEKNKIKKSKNVKKLISPSEGAGVADSALDLFGHHGIPWMAKKSVEMGRYGASELMRNKNLQKRVANYGIEKATPFIQNTISNMLDQASTKVRPNKKYKTDKKDLDGGAIDIHKLIGKLPKPKAGFTPEKYKYLGPYNPLENQLSYNPETGEVIDREVKPYNKVDEIAAYHDICYDMRKNKGDCNIPYGEMPK